MVRCSNICCCCSAKTGCMLAGVLALLSNRHFLLGVSTQNQFSAIYYFAFGILGLVDIYVTSILLDIWAIVVGFLCLLAGIIILIAYQGRKERFVMAFVLIYGTCGCFRGVYLANSLVVWIKWSQRGWRRTIDADGNDVYNNNNNNNIERTELRNYEPACIVNFVFLAICMLLDIWAVLAAIVWASQLGRVRRKKEAVAAAAAFEEKRRRSSFVLSGGNIGASALIKPVSNAGHAAADAGAAVKFLDAGGSIIRRTPEQHVLASPAHATSATPARTYQSVGTDVMGRTPKQQSIKREMKHTATQMTPKPRKDNDLNLVELRQPLLGGEVTTTTEEFVGDANGATTKRVVTTTVLREQQTVVLPLSSAAIEDVQA